LHYVNFPKIRSFNTLPKLQMLVQFLKINVTNLVELHLESLVNIWKVLSFKY